MLSSFVFIDKISEEITSNVQNISSEIYLNIRHKLISCYVTVTFSKARKKSSYRVFLEELPQWERCQTSCLANFRNEKELAVARYYLIGHLKKSGHRRCSAV